MFIRILSLLFLFFFFLLSQNLKQILDTVEVLNKDNCLIGKSFCSLILMLNFGSTYSLSGIGGQHRVR